MDKEVIKNATPEQFYENVSGRLYTLSLNQTGGVNCNMYCSIKDIETKDQHIDDLEAKLAESEKYHKWVLEFLKKYKIEPDTTPEYSQNPLIEYFKQIDDFRWCDEVEINQLKQQLAEKEKFLEQIMSGEYIPANIAEKSLKLSNQTAIAELEKVKELININGYGDNQGNVSWSSIEEIIDQQIKALKGE